MGKTAQIDLRILRDITCAIAWKVATSINVADKDVTEHISFLTINDYPGCAPDVEEEFKKY